MFDKRRKRWVGYIYETKEAKSYKRYVALQMSALRATPVNGDVSMTVEVHRGNKRRDGHNALAVLFDALQGHAYNNDKQVKRLVFERFEDPRNPRVVVEVTEL